VRELNQHGKFGRLGEGNLRAMRPAKHGDPEPLPFGKGLACKPPLAEPAGEGA
jgi:hypothetical protein